MPRKAKAAPADFDITKTPFVAKQSATLAPAIVWEMPVISVLESEMGVVQGDDLPDAPESPLAAPPSHDPPAPEQVPAHPLEAAPHNSKIVVTADGAILSTPDGFTTLVRPDPAARLPVGAKISKVLSADGETFYVATLLNSERVEEPSYHDSALEAIRLFPETHYNR